MIMDLTMLPADILHNIAVWLSIKSRLCITRGLRKSIYKHDGFWYRLYLHDYGIDRIFDDLPNTDWMERYRIRREMHTLWDTGVKTDIRAERVTYRMYCPVVLSPDGIVSMYDEAVDYEHRCRGLIARDVHCGFIHGEDGRVYRTDMVGELSYYPDLPKVKYLYASNHRDGYIITDDNRIFHIDDGVVHDMGITGKCIHITDHTGAYIDTDDNVWFSMNVGKSPETTVWSLFFGMKGKSITCCGGSFILIDLDDDLWAYGDYNKHGHLGIGEQHAYPSPVKIEGIKGLKVRMDQISTIIIDIFHNVWVSGCDFGSALGIESPGDIRTPIKWEGFKALDAYIDDMATCVIGVRLTNDGHPKGWDI